MKPLTGILQWAAPKAIAFAFRRITRGFLFIPGLLAVWGATAAFVMVWIDSLGEVQGLLAGNTLLKISPDGARAVLGTIAGTMMTVISLVYSLTLVVFTLAAGTISPRLLESFTYNRTNQITIGLLGATFIYSLIVLYITGDSQAPRASVALAIVFAVLSFFWLVYFVNDVASHIIIDNEIGRTERALRHSVEKVLPDANDDAEDISEADVVARWGEPAPVRAAAGGYVVSIDHHALRDFAADQDAFVRLHIRVGNFVLQDMAVADVYGPARNEDRTALGVNRAIVVQSSRTPDSDILFAIHLMVEIALRALSPGTDDSYTAISAIDHLTAALAQIMKRRMPSPLVRDGDGTPRLWRTMISVDDSVGQALHPIRAATAGNVLVTLRLLTAIDRMAEVADARHRPIMRRHLRLLLREAKAAVGLPEDRSEIAAAAAAVRLRLRG